MRRFVGSAVAVVLAFGGSAVIAGETPANAISGTPKVISCYKAPAAQTIGVRYRSFANTGGDEVYLGRPDLGTVANRTAQQLSWAQNADNAFSFTLDRAGDRLVSTVGANTPAYYPSAGGGLAALLSAGALDNLNIAQITVSARDTGTSVTLKDLAVDGTPIDADPNTAGVQDFTAVESTSPNFRDWMLTGLNFGDPAGWTITGKIALSGSFSASQEASRVELKLGNKVDPTVSLRGDSTVTEGTNPAAAYKVLVDGTLYEDVSVDYTTVPGTATPPGDYTTTSGTFTVPACLGTNPSINGGLTWTGWQSRGVSNQTGLWAAGDSTKPIEVFTTAFTFNAANNQITGSPLQNGQGFSRDNYTSYNSGSSTLNNPTNRPVSSGGAFSDGNTIFGIGLRIVDNAAFEALSSSTNVTTRLNARWGWGGWQFISFGRNEGSNTSYAPASTVGASDGRTSFGYSHAGDFGGNFNAGFGGGFTAQEVPIQINEGSKWTGIGNENCNSWTSGGPVNCRNHPGGSTGYRFAFRGFGQDDDASDVHTVQYFYDLTAMAKLYGRDDVSEDSTLDNYGWADNVGIGGPVNLTRAQVKVSTRDQEFSFGTMPEIRVPITNDGVGEPNESFSLAISNPVGATLGSPTSVTTTIVDDDPNTPPVASPVSVSTPEDLPVVITPTVTDAENDPLTLSVVTGPSNGAVVNNGNGTFTYTPGANFTGVDTFTYKANDGMFDSNIATVTITVTPVTAKLPDLRVSTVQPPRIKNPGVLTGGAPVTVSRTYTITRSGSAAALNRLSTVQWRTNPSPLNPATGCVSVPAVNTGTPACNFVSVAPTTLTFMPGETTKTVTVTIVGAPTVPTSGLNYRVELVNPYKANIKKGVHTMRITLK